MPFDARMSIDVRAHADAVTAAGEVLRLDADPIDYALVALYFVFVLGIGWLARQRVH